MIVQLLKEKYRKIHFIGIGGIGMSGLAKFLIAKGFRITGSDMSSSLITKELAELGAGIFIGHSAANISDQDLVVYSSAVKNDNPEMIEAASKNIKCIKRAVLLAELSGEGITLGIAGTHGKTTTSTMVGIILDKAGLDPNVFVGGIVKEFGDSNVRIGSGNYNVVEADEYDRTFLKLKPDYAIVNNVEAEHLDIYENYSNVKNAFVEYLNKLPFYGKAFINSDNPGCLEVIEEIDCDFTTFGMESGAYYKAENLVATDKGMKFDLVSDEERIENVELGVFGKHNVYNALGAMSLCLELGVDPEIIKGSLREFKGTERRFQILMNDKILLVDDYAHHPTEVEATLQTARMFNRRVIAIFQPHLFSRTKDFYKSFAEILEKYSDMIYCLDVYPAREKPIEGVTGKMITGQINSQNAEFIENNEDIFDKLNAELQNGDIVIFMGAGSITNLAKMTMEKIKNGEIVIK